MGSTLGFISYPVLTAKKEKKKKGRGTNLLPRNPHFHVNCHSLRFAFMPLCSGALYGNTLLFNRRLVYVENPQKIWGLNVIHLYTSASVLTRFVLKTEKPLAVKFGLCRSPSGLWSGSDVLRELEWKKFHHSTCPIHPSLSVLHLLTDLLSLGRSSLRHLPNAPIAASFTTVPLQRKVSPLQSRRWEVPRCDADSSTALYLWALYQGQTVIIRWISLKTKGLKCSCFSSQQPTVSIIYNCT